MIKSSIYKCEQKSIDLVSPASTRLLRHALEGGVGGDGGGGVQGGVAGGHSRTVEVLGGRRGGGVGGGEGRVVHRVLQLMQTVVVEEGGRRRRSRRLLLLLGRQEVGRPPRRLAGRAREALGLVAPVLEPDFHLRRRQLELRRDLVALRRAQVALLVEAPLQLLHLQLKTHVTKCDEKFFTNQCKTKNGWKLDS